MCGITGYLGYDDPSMLRSMCSAITHRGPDDDGFFEAPGVGLAMRRLSIIDLKTGRQPITNEAGDVWVILNGEIYNYQELTASLKSRGHRFATTSDTETIAHLYEDYGLDFVKHLRGMFGIAIWDTKRNRLVLARDRIGEKPLYYRSVDGKLLFGSELKSILQCRIGRSVRAQAVCDFLACGYVPAPRTFFNDIEKLKPGHILVHEKGQCSVQPYWQRGADGPTTTTFNQAVETVSEMLDETVRLCLKSDVEVGAFLSGGIDSSLLVALMAKHEARIQTFTVGYRGAATGFNELGFAKRMADEIGTEHHELILKPGSTIELLPKVLWHFDEPHGEPTSILVYLLCEFARKRVKVAVGGTGGDEIFFGYPKHKGIRYLQYYRMLPRFVREHLVARVVARWPESTRGSRFVKRARRFVIGAVQSGGEAYLSWTSLFSRELREQLISDAIGNSAEDPTGEAFLRSYLTANDRGDLFNSAAGVDVDGYLPEYQLTYMDRMSMAHGLEVRSPLCDYRLVDYVTSLRADYRLKGTHTKHLLKVASRQWIPRLIAERPKVGFDSPIGQWIKDELRAFTLDFLSKPQVEKSGLLNFEGVQQVVHEHLSGRRDFSLQLWSLFALEGWYRMYVEDGVTDGSDYNIRQMRGVGNEAMSAISAWEGEHHPPVSTATPGGRRNAIAGKLGLTRRKMWENVPRALRGVVGRTIGTLPSRVVLGSQFSRCLDFVDECQWWSADEANAYQLRELRRLLQFAYDRTEHYRQAFDDIGFEPHDLKSTEDIERLPIIDRHMLEQDMDRMCAVSPKAPGVDYVSTGGSGGVPMHFYIGADRSSIEYAYLVSSWRRAGYDLGTPIAVFRGRVVPEDSTGLRHEYDPILRYHYYSNFHMTDENMSRYVEHVRALGPCVLHVYPSSAATLARFLARKGESAPENIVAIIAESEIVYSDQRKMVETTFGNRYFSCYGHSEKLVAAAECEHSADYHVWPTYGFLELIDEDGIRISTPGERGEIVGTGFINRVVPFVRYRTGDFATYVGEGCGACGRSHTLLRDIRGHRTQEFLVAADGSLISWVALNMHDRTFEGVQRFQFHQTHPGIATLRLVASDGFTLEDEQNVVRSLRPKLEGRIELRVERCKTLHDSPLGKAIYVDQHIDSALLRQASSETKDTGTEVIQTV